MAGRVLTWSMAMLAASASLAVSAQSQTQTQRTLQSPTLRQAPAPVTIQNGQVALKASATAAERDRIEFETPPNSLVVVWKDPQSSGFSRVVEVVRRMPNRSVNVVGSYAFGSASREITVPIGNYLPKFNTGPAPVTYDIRIVTTETGRGLRRVAKAAQVVHLPRGSTDEPRLFSFDPFACPAGTSAPRKISISIPAFELFTRTDGNRAGTNTRSEIFFFTEFVARNDRGAAPAYSSGKRRTPLAKSDFYGAYVDTRYGPTFNLNGNTPTNDRPVLWDGTLEHDTGLHARVFMREKDNPLDDVYSGFSADVIEEMNRIPARTATAAASSSATAAMKGLGELANSVGQTTPFSPFAQQHDHHAVFDVIIENVCGQIKYMVVALRDHTEDGLYYDFQLSPDPTRFSIYEASAGAVALDTFDFKTSQQVWPAPFAFRSDSATTTIFANRNSIKSQIEVAVSVSLP